MLIWANDWQRMRLNVIILSSNTKTQLIMCSYNFQWNQAHFRQIHAFVLTTYKEHLLSVVMKQFLMLIDFDFDAIWLPCVFYMR